MAKTGGSAGSAATSTFSLTSSSDPTAGDSKFYSANRTDPQAAYAPFPAEGLSFAGRRRLANGHSYDGYRCCPNIRTAQQIASVIRQLGYSLSFKTGNWDVTDFSPRRGDVAGLLCAEIPISRIRMGANDEMKSDVWWEAAEFHLSTLLGQPALVRQVMNDSRRARDGAVSTAVSASDPPLVTPESIKRVRTQLEQTGALAEPDGDEAEDDVNFLARLFASAYLSDSIAAAQEQRRAWGVLSTQQKLPFHRPPLGDPLRVNPSSVSFGVHSKTDPPRVHIMHFTLRHSKAKDLVDSILELLAIRFCLERDTSRSASGAISVAVYNDFLRRVTRPSLGEPLSEESVHDETLVRLLSIIGLDVKTVSVFTDISRAIFISGLPKARKFYERFWAAPGSPTRATFRRCQRRTHTFINGLQCVWVTCGASESSDLSAQETATTAFALGPQIAATREVFEYDPEDSKYVPRVNVAVIGLPPEGLGDLAARAAAINISNGRILRAKLEYSGLDDAVRADLTNSMAELPRSVVDSQLSYRNAVVVVSAAFGIVNALHRSDAKTTTKPLFVFASAGETAHAFAVAAHRISKEQGFNVVVDVFRGFGPSTATGDVKREADNRETIAVDIFRGIRERLSQIEFVDDNFTAEAAMKNSVRCVFLNVEWERYQNSNAGAANGAAAHRRRTQFSAGPESDLARAAKLIASYRSTPQARPIIFVVMLPARPLAARKTMTVHRVVSDPKFHASSTDVSYAAAAPRHIVSSTVDLKTPTTTAAATDDSPTTRMLKLLLPQTKNSGGSAGSAGAQLLPVHVYCQTVGPLTAAYIVVGAPNIPEIGKIIASENQALWERFRQHANLEAIPKPIVSAAAAAAPAPLPINDKKKRRARRGRRKPRYRALPPPKFVGPLKGRWQISLPLRSK